MVSPLAEKIFFRSETSVHKMNSSNRVHPLFDGCTFIYHSFDDDNYKATTLVNVDENQIGQYLPNKVNPKEIWLKPNHKTKKPKTSYFYDLNWIIPDPEK